MTSTECRRELMPTKKQNRTFCQSEYGKSPVQSVILLGLFFGGVDNIKKKSLCKWKRLRICVTKTPLISQVKPYFWLGKCTNDRFLFYYNDYDIL